MAYKMMDRRFGKAVDPSMSRLALTEIDADNGCVFMPQADDFPIQQDIPPDDVIEELSLIMLDDNGHRINVDTSPIVDPPTGDPELDEMARQHRLNEPVWLRVAVRLSPKFATSGLK